MSVGFVFSHDESSERDDDGFDDELDGGKFIMSRYGSLVGYSFLAKEMGTWIVVVDGEMAMFVAYPFGMVILQDGAIYGLFKVYCTSSTELE